MPTRIAKYLSFRTFVGRNVMYVKPFTDIDLVARKASHFRIAMPMVSNQFKVARFSWVGSTYAVDLVRTASETAIEMVKTRQAPDKEYL